MIRQSIRITGLNTHTSSDAVTKIGDIHSLMRIHMGDINLTNWKPVTYEGIYTIDLHARYFTPRENVPHKRGQLFSMGIDPSSILADIHGQNLIHSSDDKVQYLEES